MKPNPLVSILIPAYNSEKWINSTVKSALAQTWNNKEVIIVDDGSRDNTFRIARQHESKSVKIVTQRNKGASAARNKALSLAQGDFIQWLDADDILSANKIELQLSACDYDPETKILLSSAWGTFYFRIKNASFKKNPLWQDRTPREWLFYHLEKAYYMFPAAWLVSRSLTNLSGTWDERLSYNDDGEYFCRVICKSENVKFCSESVSYHRMGNLSSISSNRTGKALDSLILSKNLCVENILKLDNSNNIKNAIIKYLYRNIFYYNLSESQKQEVLNKINSLGGKITPLPKSKKFVVFNFFLGTSYANRLKTLLWHARLLIQKYYEKILSVIFQDVV